MAMRRIPKNVSSVTRTIPSRAFLRSFAMPGSGRSLRLSATNLFDRSLQILHEIRRDPSFCVRVRADRHRDSPGEGAGDSASLPSRRAMDPGMLEQDPVFRRSGAGAEGAEQGPLRAEQLNGPRGRAGKLLDAPGKSHKPGRDYRARELGDVWC